MFGWQGENKLVSVGYAGKPVSQATLAKLSTATYTSGTLRQEGTGRAPDGGAIGDYPKGWRFLPQATKEQHEILKKNPQVAQAMRDLHNPPQGAYGKFKTDEEYKIKREAWEARQHKTIADAHYNLVIAPQIKAQEDAIARKEEEERQAIATLKMRVQELEKKPIPAVTTSPTSYLPFAVVGIVLVVILIILRRRA